MRIAVTGGTGFVGGHLAAALEATGHQVIRIGRRAGVSLDDVAGLERCFAGCQAVAHLAGINRELGDQTYQRVHLDGTRNVIAAAKRSGVRRLALLSFLRARPGCGSPYHESKWAAEELVRASGLDYLVLKAGVIYGRGDHMLDHLSRALHTFPLFLTVGMRDRMMRPTAVQDVVRILSAGLVEGRLSRCTVSVMGPEPMTLGEAVSRVAEMMERRVIVLPAPVWLHQMLGWLFERTMQVPLVAKAQVRILAEGLGQPLPGSDPLPEDLLPQTRFSPEQIRRGLPLAPRRFGWDDCLSRARAR